MEAVQHDALASCIAATDAARFPGTDTLPQELCLTLIRAFATLNVLVDEHLEGWRLSRPRLHVLAFLNRASGEVRMTDISDWLGVTKAHVTRLIDGLEADGLVERCASTQDRRAICVRITPAGQQRLEQALPRHLVHLQQLAAALDHEEQVVLSHLLAKLRQGMLDGLAKPRRVAPAFPV